MIIFYSLLVFFLVLKLADLGFKLRDLVDAEKRWGPSFVQVSDTQWKRIGVWKHAQDTFGKSIVSRSLKQSALVIVAIGGTWAMGYLQVKQGFMSPLWLVAPPLYILADVARNYLIHGLSNLMLLNLCSSDSRRVARQVQEEGLHPDSNGIYVVPAATTA